MSLRLADITARIEGVRELGTIVTALRGIAAARAQQARDQLAAVESYTQIITGAIGRALTLAADETSGPAPHEAGLALVVFGAEQGFAGAFSEHVLASIAPDANQSAVFLVGTRGVTLAQEMQIRTVWQDAMPAHTSGIPALAHRLAQALYEKISEGEVHALDVVYSQWKPGHVNQVLRRPVLPIDLPRLALPSPGYPPDAYLTREVLLARLTEDYLHAQLCHAALNAFAAENEARVEAMASAHSQVNRQMVSLTALQRHVRQEQITAEIIELATGAVASRSESEGF